MSEYLKFMEKYFPYSLKIPNEDKIYQLVCENNLMVGIILSNMDASRFYLNEEKLIFYRRYRDGVNKILIYIPLNDEIGIYACMRYSIEQLLKFIYSIYFEKNIADISRTSYRYIKEDIKKNRNIDTDIKECLLKLYTYYANYSNDLHDKEVTCNKELDFLGNIIQSENEFADGVEKDLRNILILSYKIMCHVFDIKYNLLNVSERSSLESLKSKGGKRKIYSILKRDDITE